MRDTNPPGQAGPSRPVILDWIGASMPLDDPRLGKLISLLQDNFRVRENHDPEYIDISGHLNRVWSRQHQIVFGRRGSGKSCLLVYAHRHARTIPVLSIYLSVDVIKKLTFPDILIRLLLTLFQRLAKTGFPLWNPRNWTMRHTIRQTVKDLRRELDLATQATVVHETQTRKAASLNAKVGEGVQGAGGLERSRAESIRSEFGTQKIDHLERHLQDYRDSLEDACQRLGTRHILFMLDDFYAVHQAIQPDVIDYLHRLVRGLNVYLKVGTIRHRSKLVRQEGQTIGVELHGDVEPIDLDHTLEDLPRTQDFLKDMLDQLGKKVGIASTSGEFFNPEAVRALTLASGGVARDFLTIFAEAVTTARAAGAGRWLMPTHINKAATRHSYRTKLQNIRDDLGRGAEPLARLFADLWQFCIREKKKTVFLISQDEAREFPQQHELIKQLMDSRLIHIVEPDTSAASGRPGRYEAYTLDFSIFMEPRRRNIEIVKFWETDDQRRRVGLREAPIYPLERLDVILRGDTPAELQLNSLEAESASEAKAAAAVSPSAESDDYGSLFR